MKDELKAVLNAINTDEKMLSRVNNAKGIDEVYEIISEINPGLDKDEVIAEITKFSETNMDSKLSDDDLELVAGGIDAKTCLLFALKNTN